MLDIYHRLHASEDDFFVPYDLEISNQELSHICKKAEQWRGEEGERRKVAVYDYIWQEDEEVSWTGTYRQYVLGQGVEFKGLWPDHFFELSAYLKVFEILELIDGSYFSHSHPEILVFQNWVFTKK